MDPGQLYALLRSIGQQSAHRNNDTGLWACKIPQVESRNLNDWDQKCDCSWASFRNFDAIHNPKGGKLKGFWKPIVAKL